LILQVILDVVYSHTAEDGDEAPKTISFRGIDNANYYILDKFGTYVHELPHPPVHISLLIIPGGLLNCLFLRQNDQKKTLVSFSLSPTAVHQYICIQKSVLCVFFTHEDACSLMKQSLEIRLWNCQLIQLQSSNCPKIGKVFSQQCTLVVRLCLIFHFPDETLTHARLGLSEFFLHELKLQNG
jgi:hypothetical protein